MPLLTTTIGSYPKPDYAPVANAFDLERGRWSSIGPSAEHLRRDAEAQLDRAVREVVAEQTAIGIDVPTDGEVRRENYIHYHCRHLDGFDFANRTLKVMRDGGWRAEVPTVIGPIRPGAAFLAHDWRVAQAATSRPVKMTVPGPLTITASTADAFYGDERRQAEALADALNVEIRRLAEAGCRWIQVDEPVFARDPANAANFGIELLARCFHGVPAGVRRVVHICCGYPSALDIDDYPKADPASYFLLADPLDAAPVDAVSIEDAHRPNDLRLLERFSATTVILGLVDIAKTRIETTHEIRRRLRAALDHIDARSLVAAPDCGLTMLSREIATAKLTNLVAAARSVP
jgi:5-methyltetrahydropteroyltriglutamate--homocysteine methyltransferase